MTFMFMINMLYHRCSCRFIKLRSSSLKYSVWRPTCFLVKYLFSASKWSLTFDVTWGKQGLKSDASPQVWLMLRLAKNTLARACSDLPVTCQLKYDIKFLHLLHITETRIIWSSIQNLTTYYHVCCTMTAILK